MNSNMSMSGHAATDAVHAAIYAAHAAFRINAN